MVKLLIQEVLMLLNNYSRILVLLNNYFSFFEFWLTIDPSLDVRGRVVLGLIAGTGHARIQLVPADRYIL